MAHVTETGNAPLQARATELFADAPAQHTPIVHRREALARPLGMPDETHWSRVFYHDLMNCEDPPMPLTVSRPTGVAEQTRHPRAGALPSGLAPALVVLGVQLALALLLTVVLHVLPSIPESAVLPDEETHQGAGAATVD